jgi:hypothetical protein
VLHAACCVLGAECGSNSDNHSPLITCVHCIGLMESSQPPTWCRPSYRIRSGTSHGPHSSASPQSYIALYGGSFITANTRPVSVGDTINLEDTCASEQARGFRTATFDLDALARGRPSWGLFREHRPPLYNSLSTFGRKQWPRKLWQN